ncbi:MAG: hypothetical protein QOF66_4659 [Mycobacterium sp.]|jgi:CubicO group peptidase (beta-lactamase class C family)|nr:hypothetical protein [Mycobacterium sp.]
MGDAGHACQPRSHREGTKYDRSAAGSALSAIKGQNLRGFGWDIDTALSTTRGRVFPIGSFGHAGFSGTSLWIDPRSDTYVVVLRTQSMCEGVHRCQICGVKWQRRRPGRCVFTLSASGAETIIAQSADSRWEFANHRPSASHDR